MELRGDTEGGFEQARPDRAVDRGCALVTGGSRGIGAAVARRLAADGWAVGVNYRESREAAEAVVAEITAAGARAVALGADVAEAGAADDLCSSLESEFGRPVLALVNNAAAPGVAPLLRLDEEMWQTTIDTNLTAAFRLTRRVLRPMLRERFGRIVNIASALAVQANAGRAAYAASKAGMIGLTKTVAAEVAWRGVTANAVAPGFIDTDLTRDLLDERLPSVPARRAGTPEEVAACVSFLVSEAAGYVTGSVLTVDGGLTA